MSILRARAKLDRVLKDVAVFHAEGKPPLDTAQLVKDLTEVKKIVDSVETQLLTLTSLPLGSTLTLVGTRRELEHQKV